VAGERSMKRWGQEEGTRKEGSCRSGMSDRSGRELQEGHKWQGVAGVTGMAESCRSGRNGSSGRQKWHYYRRSGVETAQE
jgi:hypothetical protein